MSLLSSLYMIRQVSGKGIHVSFFGRVFWLVCQSLNIFLLLLCAKTELDYGDTVKTKKGAMQTERSMWAKLEGMSQHHTSGTLSGSEGKRGGGGVGGESNGWRAWLEHGFCFSFSNWTISLFSLKLLTLLCLQFHSNHFFSVLSGLLCKPAAGFLLFFFVSPICFSTMMVSVKLLSTCYSANLLLSSVKSFPLLSPILFWKEHASSSLWPISLLKHSEVSVMLVLLSALDQGQALISFKKWYSLNLILNVLV